MSTRRCIAFGMMLAIAGWAGAARGETLHNGIELPEPWPPRPAELPDRLQTPPYLVTPPRVIPIDVGRQLFVDDFLIENTTMSRRYHYPVYDPNNPILVPDQPWEQKAPFALPRRAMYDPEDRLFRIFYTAGYTSPQAGVAQSPDLVHWTKFDPKGSYWHRAADPYETDPAQRYKWLKYFGSAEGYFELHVSPDGKNWTKRWTSGRAGDYTGWWYDPFRKQWTFTIRHSSPTQWRGRIARYWEFDMNDPNSVAWGNIPDAPLWLGADRGLDSPRIELGIAPQLYSVEKYSYESLTLGFFIVFRGYFHVDNDEGRRVEPDRPKANETFIGFSRDGYHWSRPEHRPFYPLSERRGAWNWGNGYPCAGVLVLGDRLCFVLGARAGKAYPGCDKEDAGGCGGLAYLRRDGFASMDAADGERTLTTRPLRFAGRRLFVNVDAAGGQLRAEVLDAAGQVIAPFSRQRCRPASVDETLHELSWDGAADLSSLAGKDVRFRFYLTNGSLYSFWVSPDDSGASHGYVAGYMYGGGPGLTGLTDTAGRAAYPAQSPPRARAGQDQSIRDADGDGLHAVRLDGSASSDEDGKVMAWQWSQEGKTIASGATPEARLAPGRHTLTLAVTDSDGLTGYDDVQIEVLPQTDPMPPRHHMILWLKADAISGLPDGQPVELWTDSSGNSLDPAQDQTGRRPVWKADAIGGRPAVRFDGIDDYLNTDHYFGLLHTFHHVTVFAVFQAAGAVGDRTLVSQDWSALGLHREGTLGYDMAHTLGNRATWLSVRTRDVGLLKPDTAYLVTMTRSGSEPGQTRLFVNGTENGDGTAIPYHNINAGIGYIGCGRHQSAFWKGDIAELIIYGTALSDDQRKGVEAYLAARYGIVP